MLASFRSTHLLDLVGQISVFHFPAFQFMIGRIIHGEKDEYEAYVFEVCRSYGEKGARSSPVTSAPNQRRLARHVLKVEAIHEIFRNPTFFSLLHQMTRSHAREANSSVSLSAGTSCHN